MHCSIYIDLPSLVAVFKASMLEWEVNLPWVYMHCSIYIDVPSLV